MNYVLVEIKNFLKKLENGQLEIEAGQWELHKDITNVKKALEELKELKEDFAKVRVSNVQQLGLIKNLEEKINHFKLDRTSCEPVKVTESVNFEKVYKRPPDDSAKGYKKRKCRVLRSEEVIEVTSQISDENTELTEESQTETKESDETGKVYEHDNKGPQAVSPKPQNSRSPKNEILQRYLKDSAKYKDKKPSQEPEFSCQEEKSNHEQENTPFWDEYRAPTNFKPKENSSKSEKTSECVLPKRLACPRCPKKFTYKIDFLRHEREHNRAKSKFICSICGKRLYTKDRLKMHRLVHKASFKSSKGYRCSYCDVVCATPEELTAHLRECRTIRRSRFKKRKL